MSVGSLEIFEPVPGSSHDPLAGVDSIHLITAVIAADGASLADGDGRTLHRVVGVVVAYVPPHRDRLEDRYLLEVGGGDFVDAPVFNKRLEPGGYPVLDPGDRGSDGTTADLVHGKLKSVHDEVQLVGAYRDVGHIVLTTGIGDSVAGKGVVDAFGADPDPHGNGLTADLQATSLDGTVADTSRSLTANDVHGNERNKYKNAEVDESSPLFHRIQRLPLRIHSFGVSTDGGSHCRGKKKKPGNF